LSVTAFAPGDDAGAGLGGGFIIIARVMPLLIAPIALMLSSPEDSSVLPRGARRLTRTMNRKR
jgi:hypothetical protein